MVQGDSVHEENDEAGNFMSYMIGVQYSSSLKTVILAYGIVKHNEEFKSTSGISICSIYHFGNTKMLDPCARA